MPSKEHSHLNDLLLVGRVENIGLRGEGIVRYRGMPVFIPGVLPEENIEFKITEQHKSYARGLCLNILTKSEHRQDPLCSHFPSCGGCQLMHFAMEQQLQWKKRNLGETLRHMTGLSLEVAEIAHAQPYQMRNKAIYPVGYTPEGKIGLGFFRSRSHDLIMIDSCPMQTDLSNKLLGLLPQLLSSYPQITAYDERKHNGLLRHVLLRTNRDESQILLSLVVNASHYELPSSFIDDLVSEIPQLKGIIVNYNPSKGNTVLSTSKKVVWGEDRIEDYIGDLKFYSSSTSFFQTNRHLTADLYQLALEQASLKGTELILEAYCGAGTISAFLARKAQTVIGIEVNQGAVDEAISNAQLNELTNLSFQCGLAEIVLPKMLQEGSVPDLIVVDPPRQGCSPELLIAVAEAEIDKLLYISCNPATFARDLVIMGERGYRPGVCYPVDMFPWTEHLELVCCLERL